jgi:UbiD family decarboxylase
MNLRQFIASAPGLVRIERPVSPWLEAAGVIAALDGSPVLFEDVAGWRLLSGLCSSRAGIAASLGLSEMALLQHLSAAMRQPSQPPILTSAPCQEVRLQPPHLSRLPILKHIEGDGGPYITAGVAVVNDPVFGRNVSIHRMMLIGERELVVRVVEGRGTHTAWSRSEEDLPIAVAIGCPIQVLLAAAMSPAKGVDEFGIANALAPTPLVNCLTNPLQVPAEAELIIEGRLTHRMAQEGPFIDLTETWDGVRPQPVFEVDCITHRNDPIYHAILPGLTEHKLLMGLPREPGIYNAVASVCDVRNVKLSPGGMCWLHALVQIRKRTPEDGRRAIEATLQGHPSVKMVTVVDDDVDIDDPYQVEWAVATRVQAGQDVYIYRDQPSSSLDPSARQIPGRRGLTDKMGIDATIPWPASASEAEVERRLLDFRRVAYPQANLADYRPRGHVGG